MPLCDNTSSENVDDVNVVNSGRYCRIRALL